MPLTCRTQPIGPQHFNADLRYGAGLTIRCDNGLKMKETGRTYGPVLHHLRSTMQAGWRVKHL
ncbi:hypothetical protein AA18895_2106 [Acetobacter ghanensis DSM 18895]|nr:hypothetical protein AA18895_2106 [Acetobacter ghanensis DSM 18895]